MSKPGQPGQRRGSEELSQQLPSTTLLPVEPRFPTKEPQLGSGIRQIDFVT